MTSLELSILGSPIVMKDGRQVSLPRKKCLALLSYMAVEGATTRDTLAALMWPESDQQRAFGSLRGTIHAIGEVLGESAIAATAGSVSLGADNTWSVDFRELDRAYLVLSAGKQLSLEETDNCIRLYRGDFMKGFYVRGTAVFEDWQIAQTALYRRTIKTLLIATIQKMQDDRRIRAAIRLAEVLVSLSGADESSHRTLMTLYAKAGRKKDAVVQYRRCVDLLKRDLDDEPDTETRELLESIKAGRIVPSSSTDSTEIAGSIISSRKRNARDVFIGRSAEIESMKEALVRTAAGSGTIEFIVGEAGIGKTFLARRIENDAEAMGFRVLKGNCIADGAAPPFWPWTEILRNYATTVGNDRFMKDLGEGAEHMLPILPITLRKAVCSSKGNDTADREQSSQEQFFLFVSMVEFFCRISENTPLMIVIEDIHWADASTLHMLNHIARQIDVSAIYVLCSCRNREFDRRHPLPKVLGDISRFQELKRYNLVGFTTSEIIEYLGEIAPRLLELHEKAHQIQAATDGNPLFVRHLGYLLDDPAVLGSSGIGRVPEGIREAVGSHLGDLSEQCNQVLRELAVIGAGFTLDLIMQLKGDTSMSMVLESISEALSMHVLEVSPDSYSEYKFAHELVRQVILEIIPFPERICLHAKIGRALESMYFNGRQVSAAEVLHHFSQAEILVGKHKVAEMALAAGREALSMHAFGEAFAYFDAGYRAVSELADDATRAWLLFYRAALPPDIRSGAWDIAHDDLMEALDYFDQRRDESVIAEFFRLPCRAYYSRNMESVCQKFLSIIGPKSERWRCYIDAVIGMNLYVYQGARTEAVAEGRRLIDQALLHVRETNDIAFQHHLYLAKAHLAFVAGNVEESLFCNRKGIELLSLYPHEPIELNYRVWECDCLERLDRFEERDEAIKDLLEACRSSAHPNLIREAWRIEAEEALRRGDLKRAERIYENPDDPASPRCEIDTNSEIRLAVFRGEYDKIVDTLCSLMDAATTDEPRVWEMTWFNSTAPIHWDDELARKMKNSAARCLTHPACGYRWQVFAKTVLTVVAAHDQGEAAEAPYYEDIAPEMLDDGYRVKGWIAMKLGRIDDALRLLRKCCHEPERLRLQFVWGLCHLSET